MSSASFHAHFQTATWTKRDSRLDSRSRIADVTEFPILRDSSEKQQPLYPRELLAEADARTTAERKVGKLRPRRRGLGQPPVGIEAVGIRVEPRIAMHDVLRH